MLRRCGRLACLPAAMLAWAAPVAAQNQYPTKSITMIVPFGAGGSSDAFARVIADRMARHLGETIVIENDGGAGGTIATARVARSTPDGYIIVMGNMGTHGAAPAQHPNLRYDPRKDFTPIGLSAGVPMVIVTKPTFPARTLGEFVAYLKANPGKVNEGHAGVGSQTHAVCSLLHATIKTSTARVAYRSMGNVINDMVGNQIDFGCAALASTVSQVQAGTVRGLAIASPRRNPAIPDIPTTAEANLPEFQVSAWNALFGPLGLPQAVRARLVEAHTAALDDEATRKRLVDIGGELPETSQRTPEALQRLVESEVARWSAVLKATH